MSDCLEDVCLNKESFFTDSQFLRWQVPFEGVYAPVFPVMKSRSAECFDSELNLQLEFKGKPFQLL